MYQKVQRIGKTWKKGQGLEEYDVILSDFCPDSASLIILVLCLQLTTPLSGSCRNEQMDVCSTYVKYEQCG